VWAVRLVSPMTHNRAGDKGEKKSWEKMGLREQLIGAWRLVSYIESPVDGSPKRVPMGEKAQGIIMYTPDGYVSAQLMTPGRRNFASGDWFKGTPEETAEEASGYIAYSGPFHVDEDRQSLMAVTATLKRRALEAVIESISLSPGSRYGYLRWESSTRPTLIKSGIARETMPTCLLRSSKRIHHADTTWA
jgi:Lipocalin-like domain